MQYPWPDWLNDIWAKSRPEGEKSGESLARHTLDVLDRLSRAVELRPNLPQEVEFPGLWRCLFWACLLHDWGKCARGFQVRLRGGPKWSHRHEVASLLFVDWIESAVSPDEQIWVAAAIASHHLDAREIERLYPDLDDYDGDDAERDPVRSLVREIDDSCIEGLRRWLVECVDSWIKMLGLRIAGVEIPDLALLRDPADNGSFLQRASRIRYWLNAYLTVADRMSSREERLFRVGALALRGHMVCCDHTASAHAGPLPPSFLGGTGVLVERLGLSRDSLYDHQRACAALCGSAILVAPTGSGKTESALLWASAQSKPERPVPRLFYMLPYQASMNAMYDRLVQAFPSQIGLEHGRSTLALYRRLLESDYTPLNAARMAKWGKNLARLNYYPVRVLSPYQMLKGAYRLRGYESLLSDYFDANVILDEVHAYEPQRLALILAMARYLREYFNVRFFVMSATLPLMLTNHLREAIGSLSFVRATPELFQQFRRHMIETMNGEITSEDALSAIVEAARACQSVLVCANTVDRAQALFETLRMRLRGDVSVQLLHGRFNGRDRLTKEKVVRGSVGARSITRKAIVLVATQVVEVSLDIDLDTIFTEPAPLEALIQRFGRINRRRLRDYSIVRVFCQPQDGQGVYEADLVKAAIGILARNNGEFIDEDAVSSWLDEVYCGAVGERWEAAYRKAFRLFYDGCLESLRAFNSDDWLQEEFYRAFDATEILPACLQSEYVRLRDDEPLRAQELLVPISYKRLGILRSIGRLRQCDTRWPCVVEADYDEEHGLRL